MTTATKETMQQELTFLEEAADVIRELPVLRNRLSIAQREHAELLGERELALREGRDLLPEIKVRFEIVEELPAQILQLEQRAWWIIENGVKQIDLLNIQRAGRNDAECRNELRIALEVFRPVCASVLNTAAQAASQGCRSAEGLNRRLSEIEAALEAGRLPRVSFRPHNLPTLDADRLSREGLLAALDNFIAQLG